MKNSDLKGLPAINIADGAKIGDVERAYFDPVKKHVAGFAIAVEGGFLHPERAVIADTIEIHSLGSGALTLDSAEPQGVDTSQRYGELIDLDEIVGRDVYTEGGVHVGHVSAAEFDERTFTLAEIEVAAGALRHQRAISVGQITTIGSDVVVVSSAVLDPPPPEVIPRAESSNQEETEAQPAG
ncbi:MAG: PRC-barrel domain-containing protein [Chloroflexota bacterium]|nr:PRC-barrel domain-containing protein [Chloroflexota bacterium]